MKYCANYEVSFDSEEEFNDLVSECMTMVSSGAYTERFRDYFEGWRKDNGLDERQGLFMMATVFPLKIFVSALKSPYKLEGFQCFEKSSLT